MGESLYLRYSDVATSLDDSGEGVGIPGSVALGT
jgi:hypothetical protein